MKATIEQLAQILIFSDLESSELERLQAYSQVKQFQPAEIVMQEGDQLPAKLYALLNGSLRVTKTSAAGKETILRTLLPGEIFAAPALLGNGIAPAAVTAESDSEILTVDRNALLEAIQQKPEIAL